MSKPYEDHPLYEDHPSYEDHKTKNKPVICEGCGTGPCHYANHGRLEMKWSKCAVPKGEGLSMQDRSFEGGVGPGYKRSAGSDVLGRPKRPTMQRP